MHPVLFLLTLCTVRTGLPWRTHHLLWRWGRLLPFWLLILKVFFFPLSSPSWSESILWWTWEPQELAFGLVLLSFGFQLSIFTVLHTRRLLLGLRSLRPWRWGQHPTLSAWVSGPLPCLLVPEATGRMSTPPACQPPASGPGWEVTSQNTCTFPSTNGTSHKSTGAGGRRPLPEAAASGDESCLTSSVLTFPKRCLTGFVFTVIIVECCACLGSVFLFSTSEQTGLTSHVLTRRTQLMWLFSSERLFRVDARLWKMQKEKKKSIFFLGSYQLTPWLDSNLSCAGKGKSSRSVTWHCRVMLCWYMSSTCWYFLYRVWSVFESFVSVLFLSDPQGGFLY